MSIDFMRWKVVKLMLVRSVLANSSTGYKKKYISSKTGIVADIRRGIVVE
jgi:hypothetical protein